MNDSSDSLVAAGFRRDEGGAGNQIATRRSTELAAPAPPGAENNRFDVADLVRIWQKWKWLILGITAACVLLAILMTLTTTRLYRSTAVVQINTESTSYMPDSGNGGRGGGGGRQVHDQTFLTTQYGLLASRSLAERVARTLNLGSDATFVGSNGHAAGEAAAASRLMGGLTVTPQRGSSLVQITYTDTNPQRAATVINAFARAYIDTGIERRFQNSAFARDFLQNRLASTRTRLEASERALVAYARQANILSLDSGGGSGGGQGGDGGGAPSGDTLSAQSLVAFNTALSQATRDRIEAEQIYRQALANGSAAETANNAAVQALRGQRAALDADYQQRLSTFRPDFPDMVALRQRIASLDRSIAAETGNATTALRAAYEAARGREQQLLGQVNNYRGNVLNLRTRGIQYNILQRDVETNRTLYNALLQRYKEIGLAGGVGDAEASVVDGGDVPGGPFSPRPMLNLLIGIVAGLALGFGAAFAIEFIDDTIKSPDDVLRKLHLPAIGLVPRAPAGSSVVEELRDQRSEVAEAYFTIVSSLQYVAASSGFPRSLLRHQLARGRGQVEHVARHRAEPGADRRAHAADRRRHAQAVVQVAGRGQARPVVAAANASVAALASERGEIFESAAPPKNTTTSAFDGTSAAAVTKVLPEALAA